MAGPVGLADLEQIQDSSGRVLDQYNLRRDSFYRGVTPESRPLLWKFFLGFYPYDSSREERAVLDRTKKEEYERLVRGWRAELPHSSFMADYSRLIQKDVARTDKDQAFFKLPSTDQALTNILMALVYHDPSLGYIQGMNDLLSPLLLTLTAEHEAFWCLVTLLKRRRHNFEDLTLSGSLGLLARLLQYLDHALYLHLELLCQDCDWLFCYRWILLDFKREFLMSSTCSIWEAMWACPFTGEFGMFVAAAILLHMQDSLRAMTSFEDLMQFSSGLFQSLPLEPILSTARGLLHRLQGDEDCPRNLRVLRESSFLAPPPPLIGFVRMRQSLSTRKANITHINVWTTIFGDAPKRPIVQPLQATPTVTPPTSGFVPRNDTSDEHQPTSPPHQHTSHQHTSHQHTSHQHTSHQHTSVVSPNFDELRSEPNLDFLS